MGKVVADWILESTSTIGTGDITLNGAPSGYSPFSDAWPASSTVWYTIVEGNNRECGKGTFDGVDTLVRTTVHSTLISGVYNDTDPTPYSLQGTATVAVTFNADAFNQFMDHVEATSDAHATSAITGLDAALAALTPATDLAEHYAGTAGRHPTTDIDFPTDNTGTITPTLQAAIDRFESATIISGCLLTPSATAGAVDLTEGACLFKAGDTGNDDGTIVWQYVAAVTGIAIPDGNSLLVYLEFNPDMLSPPTLKTVSGNILASDIIALGNTDSVPVGIANYSDGIVSYVNIGNFGLQHAWKNEARLLDLQIQRTPGSSIISQSTTNDLAFVCNAGTYYLGVNRMTHPAFSGGTFKYWYKTTGGAWVKDGTATQVDNLYKLGATARELITTGQYTINWVYGVMSDTGMVFHVLYSSVDEALLADALLVAPPTDLPDVLTNNLMATLLGRIEIQQGNSSIISVDSAFLEDIPFGVATSHSLLADLQGGAAGEYYHLTTAQHTYLTSNVFKGYGETEEDLGLIGGAVELDVAEGNVKTATITSNTTFTITTIHTATSFSILLTNAGAFTTAFTGVLWAGGTAPTFTTAGDDLILLSKTGGNWIGTAILDVQ